MAPRLGIALRALLLLFVSTTALAATPGNRWTPPQARPYRPPLHRPSPSAAKDGNSTPVPTRHRTPGSSQLFGANHEKTFAWFDPVKHQELFGIPASAPARPGHAVSKRTGRGPPSTGPAIPNDNCLGCASVPQGAVWNLNDFDVDFFINQALWKKGQADSQCLFYSPTYTPDDEALWLLAGRSPSELRPDGGSPRLSSVATKYACNNNMKTIWMTWPGKSSDYEDSATNPKKVNLWEISEPGSWLYPLSNAVTGKPIIQWTFFAHMSEALATICTGTIYTMSIRPLDMMHTYDKPHPISKMESILTTVEFKTLLQRYQQKDAIGQFIAIDATDPSIMYELDPDNQLIASRQLGPDEMALEHSHVLRWINATSEGLPARPLSARDTCGANLAYEDGEDWFG